MMKLSDFNTWVDNRVFLSIAKVVHAFDKGELSANEIEGLRGILEFYGDPTKPSPQGIMMAKDNKPYC